MRCDKCGNVERFDKDGICLMCGHNMNPPRPRSGELPPVDPFKLADGLAKNTERKTDEGKFIEKIIGDVTGETYKGKLEICPKCGHRTWFYDKGENKHICFRRECPSNSLSTFLTEYFLHSHED